MTISSPSASITAAGCSAPVFQDVLTYFQNGYQAIVGADAIVSNDSMMGQLLSSVAMSLSDSNSAVFQTYNGFSPDNASGVYLSSLVKINGIGRQVPTNSTAIIRCTGQAGQSVQNGVVQDVNGNLWDIGGFEFPVTPDYADVLGTCETVGAIIAPAGTINKIQNPQYGWQTAVSISDATPGNPVETDYALRNRQSVSTSNSANAIAASIESGALSISGVTFAQVYQNNSSVTDANGLPPKSLCLVTQGGDPTLIATMIANKKSIGCLAYGTTTEDITVGGNTMPISFSPVSNVELTATITIHAFPSYTALNGSQIGTNLANYVNDLGIGETVYLNSSIAAIADPTFNVTTFAYTITSGTATIDGSGNVLIPFNGIAIVSPTITLTVA